MGRIWMPGGAGGADVDVVTAGAGDVLSGKVIVGPDGEPLTGTLALTGNAADSQVLTGRTYYNTDAKAKRTGTMANQGAKTAALNCGGSYVIPAGYHNGSGKVTANSLAAQTSANAAAADILSGKTAYVNGSKITGSMGTMAGGTYTSGSADQTISCSGKKMTGNIVVKAVNASSLISGNQAVFNKGVFAFSPGFHPYYVNGYAPYSNAAGGGPWFADGTGDLGVEGVLKGCVMGNNSASNGSANSVLVLKGSLNLAYFSKIQVRFYSGNGGIGKTTRFTNKIYLIAKDKKSHTVSQEFFNEIDFCYSATITWTIPSAWKKECFIGVNGKYTDGGTKHWHWVSNIILVP